MLNSPFIDPSAGSAAFLANCTADLAQLIPVAGEAASARNYGTGITCADSLAPDTTGDDTRHDVAITNPPFSGTVDSDSSGKAERLKTGKTEMLFVQRIIDRLRPGGRACMLIPTGTLFGSSNAHMGLRKRLIELCSLDAVISLPAGTFMPYSGLTTALIIFRKGSGPTRRIWFAEVDQIGYSLDKKRRPHDKSDLPEVLRAFREHEQAGDNDRAAKHFFVPADEVRAEDYILSFSRYRTAAPVEQEYDTPENILRDMMMGQVQINECLDSLAAMTGCSFRTKDFMGSDGGLNALAASLNLDMRVTDFSADTAE